MERSCTRRVGQTTPVQYAAVQGRWGWARWRDRTGVFYRDLGDDEHTEIVIADRTYRVHIADLA